MSTQADPNLIARRMIEEMELEEFVRPARLATMRQEVDKSRASKWLYADSYFSDEYEEECERHRQEREEYAAMCDGGQVDDFD